jgi:hypothetical protein
MVKAKSLFENAIPGSRRDEEADVLGYIMQPIRLLTSAAAIFKQALIRLHDH